MSEHRRKPPQSRGRRAAQPPSSGRRAAPPSGATTSSYGAPSERPYGSRAEARRAGQRSVGVGAGAGRRAGGGSGPRGPRGRRPEPPPKKRFIDYPRSDKHGLRRWVPSWKQITGMCIAFLGLMVGLAGIAFWMVEVPDEANAAALQQNNVYYWKDGSVMGRDGDTNRQNVDISKIPQSMQNAAIAAENATFREDSGIDPKGIARAVVNMARGEDTQGGSTITQQFVKNNYLSQEQTVTRKAKELFISIKVGTTRDKDEILQGYLNTSYYGRGAYGIQAAAQAYYGKDAEELEPDEGAMLATLLKGANLYDPAGGVGASATPSENKKRATKRWNWIMDRQVEVGLMTEKERAEFDKFPMPDPRQEADKSGQVGYLMETARQYVQAKTGLDEKTLGRGGYQVYTTFEQKKTDALEKSVKRVRKENLDLKERPEKDKYVQFGAASVKPNDGAIVALYGGEGYDKGHFSNNANTLGVPVGSTWKPFVLGAALEHGTYKTENRPLSPESKYNGDNKIKIKDQNGNDFLDDEDEPFRQVNDGGKSYGDITIREAMERSANTPFVQLGMDVGMSKVKDAAMASGIKEESINPDLNPSFALGTSTPSAIRMADAYATFAASGTQTEPYSVTEVKHNGEDMEGFEKPNRESVMDSNVANNVTDVLQGVIDEPHGTGTAAKALKRPAAGKTGTTDENKSAWWVGYTPDLSTAVTMFRTDPESNKLLSMNGVGGFDSIHGGALPTEVWTEYMTAALKGTTPKNFPDAEPIGDKADGEGVETPSPPPSETPDEEPEEEPTEEESEEPSEEPSPTRSDNCEPNDVFCEDNGGTNEGETGDTGGETSGETEGTDVGGSGGDTEGTDDGGGGNGGNGNGNSNGGGLFAGRGDEFE